MKKYKHCYFDLIAYSPEVGDLDFYDQNIENLKSDLKKWFNKKLDDYLFDLKIIKINQCVETKYGTEAIVDRSDLIDEFQNEINEIYEEAKRAYDECEPEPQLYRWSPVRRA